MLQKLREKFSNGGMNRNVNPKPMSAKSKIIKTIILTIILTLIMATPVFADGAGFIEEAVGWLGWLIIAIGGGLGAWGIVNLVEGYGNDNRATRS